MSKLSFVTCKNCGWVHFAVKRAYAEKQVALMRIHQEALTAKELQDYYGGKYATIKEYERCGFCGGSWQDFRPSKVGDCPDGCTISPILDFHEAKKKRAK